VHALQGFRFGKPAPAETITDRMQQTAFKPVHAAAG
jgi:hypothetical protein